MTVPEFISIWRKVDVTERSGAQQHFLGLCELVGHPKPVEMDPTGESFTFERGAEKNTGGDGFADVWKKGFFGWEYKGRHKNLDAAYQQLLRYAQALENPPLLVVCDMERIVIHANFTNTPHVTHEIALEDLTRPESLSLLRNVFFDPEKLKPGITIQSITTEAARQLAEIAQSMRKRGLPALEVAHFLDRMIFCLFAEDVGLLPRGLFSRVLKNSRGDPARFRKAVAQLFEAMAEGGLFGEHKILHFNGNLFTDATVLDMEAEEVERIAAISTLDWSAVDPSIFGTLFERGLDPDKRSQLGAHYTSRQDIEVLVEPVVMQPLRREWAEVRGICDNLLATGKKNVGPAPSLANANVGQPPPAANGNVGPAPSLANCSAGVSPATASQPGAAAPHGTAWPPRAAALHKLTPAVRAKALKEATALVRRFLMDRLANVKVLDPACGSGNFLYVTLQKLKDLEKEVNLYAARNGMGGFLPLVGPWQLYGIEINPYAWELAQMTVWIGYLQWMRDNGMGNVSEPVLRKLHNFQNMDAIIDLGEANAGPAPSLANKDVGQAPSPANHNVGPAPSLANCGAGFQPATALPPEAAALHTAFPREPEWPKVDFIVGNPPFLGGKLLRRELGDDYVNRLLALWKDRVPAEADLCCYWFEKARSQVEKGLCKRAGLLATQGIRGGANRKVLERIKQTGDIFFAESDREWVLNGANVHISMIGFDDGEEKNKVLDGKPVPVVNSNLSCTADTTRAGRLAENLNLSYMGTTKGGSFDIDEKEALHLLRQPNPHGRPNSDVVVPWVNGMDVTRRPRDMWIIDYGVGRSEHDAALYEAPFAYAKERVKPERQKSRTTVDQWWLHERSRAEMRAALCVLPRFLATVAVSKHRLFVWMSAPTLPDHAAFAFSRSDDYFFGVLHSRVHEVWARAQGTQLRERESGFRYTPTTCFETFPMPRPTPEQERAIADAARELDTLRNNWLNPPEWTKEEVLEFPGSMDGPWARYIVGAGRAAQSVSQVGRPSLAAGHVGPAPSLANENVGQAPSPANGNVRPAPSLANCSAGVSPATASPPGAAAPHATAWPPGAAALHTATAPQPGAAALHTATASQPGAAAPHGIGTVRYPRMVPKDEASARLLSKRTLTNLYNARPDWLALAHRRLDEAVFAAYGWDASIGDDELLGRLLALNLERAAG